MVDQISFDILLLGLKDGSSAGRAKYTNVMERLTGRPADHFEVPSKRSEEPIFRALDRDTAIKVVDALGKQGALIEVRRTTSAPQDVRDQVVDTITCPRCDFMQPAGTDECTRCGLVFAKFEREQVQHMQKSRALEEALTRALQSRDEWAQKAAQYLEGHPLKEGSIDGFENILARDEVPFLRLVADEGPILMTSRRLISSLKEGFISIPYEMVGDVTVGGGLVQKKNRVRLQLAFHAPIPTPPGPSKQLNWQLDKDSSFYKDVIMDWCYSRNFLCGGCGQRDLDFRLDGTKPRARCMHCATDHDIDLREAIAVPLSPEVTGTEE
jgi:uncharacterized C2H2 Zn-finger protein